MQLQRARGREKERERERELVEGEKRKLGGIWGGGRQPSGCRKLQDQWISNTPLALVPLPNNPFIHRGLPGKRENKTRDICQAYRQMCEVSAMFVGVKFAPQNS